MVFRSKTQLLPGLCFIGPSGLIEFHSIGNALPANFGKVNIYEPMLEILNMALVGRMLKRNSLRVQI